MELSANARPVTDSTRVKEIVDAFLEESSAKMM